MHGMPSFEMNSCFCFIHYFFVVNGNNIAAVHPAKNIHGHIFYHLRNRQGGDVRCFMVNAINTAIPCYGFYKQYIERRNKYKLIVAGNTNRVV